MKPGNIPKSFLRRLLLIRHFTETKQTKEWIIEHSLFKKKFLVLGSILIILFNASCFPTIQGEDINLDPFSERILPQDTQLTFVDSTGAVFNLSLKRKTNYMVNISNGTIMGNVNMAYNLHEKWSKIYSGDGLSISFELRVQIPNERRDYLTIEVFSEEKNMNIQYDLNRAQGDDEVFWSGALKKREVHFNTVSYTDVYRCQTGENPYYLKQDYGLISFKFRGITYYLLN